MSIPPNLLTTLLIDSLTCSLLLKSHFIQVHLFFISLSILLKFLSKRTTSIFSFKNFLATADPIFPAPPVMTAIFPSNFFLFLEFSLALYRGQYSILKISF